MSYNPHHLVPDRRNFTTMEGELKAILFCNNAALANLFGQFLDFKENPAGDEITQEFNFIQQLLSLKLQTLSDLNERILETLSEEDIESEITNTDEYMYE